MRWRALFRGALCALLGVAASAEAGNRHLVLFGGSGVPSAFETNVRTLGGDVTFSHAAGVAIVEGLSDGAAAKLVGRNRVVQVDRDSSFQINARIGATAQVAGDVTESPFNPAGAYFYARQWNMRAVKANEVWAAGRFGSPAVTVAVIDTGIDYLYPDLDGRVDLARSVSFVPDDDALVDYYFPGRHHVTDLYFHGTHVAATVASNSYVAAGVTTQTTLMGVKVCSVEGVCEFGSIIQGVLWAADHGADVANLSLGGAFTKAGGNGRYVGYINKVFNYAHGRGMTVVVSAGNSAIDLDHDKNGYKTYCSTPNTICVSATGPTGASSVNGPWTDVDAPAPYTNYGRSAINVAAPGGSDWGYVWAACSQTSLVIPVCQTGIYIVGATGTSMAAPHATGLASLLVEDLGRNPGQIRARIQQTADDLGQPGTDPYYGKGRINVGQAAE
jgi:subtilisin family serine protease